MIQEDNKSTGTNFRLNRITGEGLNREKIKILDRIKKSTSDTSLEITNPTELSYYYYYLYD